MFARVTDASGWNQEVLRRGGGFLQSWEWGEFQRASAAEVLRLRGESGLAQLVRRGLPLGLSYWYCPRGPVGDVDPSALVSEPEIARGLFLRFEPQTLHLMPQAALKVRDVQPGRTLLLDLKQEPDAIMAAMHEKTRYNIRLAEKKGVRVYAASGRDSNAFTQFEALLAETTGREGFRGHEPSHYRKMLEALAGDWEDARERAVARLMLAEHDGRVLAASLMIGFGRTITYLHGASSRVRRQVMAPYLLHWKTMLEARESGFLTYDFWGIAPEGDERHPWAGFTRFKRGFGGTAFDYPGTYDLPIRRCWYTLYRLARRAHP